MYEYKYLDLIEDRFFYSGDAAHEKLTLFSMPLYAFFERGGDVLPLRFAAVLHILQAENGELWRVSLCKSELLKARNAFLAFEKEQELYQINYSYLRIAAPSSLLSASDAA